MKIIKATILILSETNYNRVKSISMTNQKC